MTKSISQKLLFRIKSETTRDLRPERVATKGLLKLSLLNRHGTSNLP